MVNLVTSSALPLQELFHAYLYAHRHFSPLPNGSLPRSNSQAVSRQVCDQDGDSGCDHNCSLQSSGILRRDTPEPLEHSVNSHKTIIRKTVSTIQLCPDYRIVLVEPRFEESIGFVARAMKNFGLTSLRLVKPVTDFGHNGRMRGGHAQDVLDSTTVHESLLKALDGSIFRSAQQPREHSLQQISSGGQ
ncbi:RNA methyltransferase [Candidatus Bathyarchaeota archaeon]|nr:MAG: RNA methyltransferase [Candidatus Bathyarchaeota archaeon]